MIKRLTALTVALGVFGTAASAEAAVRAGVFRGKTDQNAPLQLRVLSNKKAVVKFAWEGAVMGCTDGSTRQTNGFISPASVKIPLSRSGKFKFTARGNQGAVEFVTVGTIKGNRATGALQVQARVNEEGSFDPNGSIVCDSELVGWTAKRR